jgi:hypothetical protein
VNKEEAGRVLEAIREAFREAVCPAEPTGPADDWQRGEIRRKFAGVPWAEVPADVLAYESSALAYFTAEGFAHYLPAYMALTLTEAASSETAAFNTVIAVIPPADGRQAIWWRDRVARFTAPQRRAVRAFLEVVQSKYGDAMGPEFEQAIFWWGRSAERKR